MNNKENQVYKTVISRRSIRRFKQKEIPLDILKKCVNAARLAPTAANLQPLEFVVVNKKELCDKIFESLGFAGYLTDWNPELSESPAGYIIILVNDSKNKWSIRDASFAAGNITITAESFDIGTCVLCNINKEKIRNILKIPESILIDSVVALGYKDEESIIEDFKGSVKYYRDKKNVLHVPKKKLEEIIHINKF